jgi:HD superfamily phosphohydrolase YqeK
VWDLNKHEAEHLLEHWIEHNESHSRSFRERARQLAELSQKAAQDVEEAAILMDKCTQMLRKAVEDL